MDEQKPVEYVFDFARLTMTTLNGMFSTFNTKFDTGTRAHLKNVYACLTMSLLSASAGAYTHLFTSLVRGGGLLFALVGAACALGN